MTILLAVVAIVLIPSMFELLLTTLGGGLALLKSRTPPTGIVAKGSLAFVIPCERADGLAETVHSLRRLRDSFGEHHIAVATYGSNGEVKKCCKDLGITDLCMGKTRTEAIRSACSHFIERECLGIVLLQPGSVVTSTVPLGLRRAFGKGQGVVQLRLQLEKTEEEWSQVNRVGFSCSHYLRALGRSYWGLPGGVWDDGVALRSDIVKLVPYDVHVSSYYWQLLESGIDVGYAAEASVYVLEKKEKPFSMQIWFEDACDLLLKIRRGNRRLIEPFLAHATLPLLSLLPLLLLVTFFFESSLGAYGICFTICHIGLGGYCEGINPFKVRTLIGLWKRETIRMTKWWKRMRGNAWIRTSRGVQ